MSSWRLTETLGRLRADKDLTQAALLFEALVQTRHGDELTDAWEEAWNRGDAWKEGIVSGLSRLPKNGVDALKTTLGSDIVESLLKK